MVGVVAAQSMRDEMAVMDSLRAVHPRLRNRWLNERGLELPGYNAPVPEADRPDSSGLRLVGKYGRGPSVEVTGKDSLVFLSLGSEVAIINFSDTANPHVLAEVQAMGLVTQAAVRDSFLYLGCNSGQAGVEVWNVQNPSAPVFRSRTPTLLSDFCVRDTFLYLTQSLSGPNDTFKVYSIANPENMYLLGSCRDSGDAITVTNSAAFLADRWGLYSIDVTDPRNPHHVGSYPGMPISVESRGNICCVTFGNPNQPEWLRFTVLDVTNPANVVQLGSIDSCGGYDIHMDSSLAFVSGYYTGGHEFRVVSIVDSSHPVRVGACSTPGDNWGVWSCMARRRAFVADNYEGLSVIDLQNLSAPLLDTTIVAAAFANDVHVAESVCYVADGPAGMRILDLSDPTRPREIGAVDTTGDCYSQSVVARDSFAFTDWAYPYLRSISVTDPAKPDKAGACIIFNRAEDMALRDSLLYVAEDDKFQVVNVARPRAPQVVGTCALQSSSTSLFVADSLAYVGNWPSPVIDVRDPTHPVVIGSFPVPSGGISVRDTFAYVARTYDSFYVYSVANPTSPARLGALDLSGGQAYGQYNLSVEVVDTVAYIGGWQLKTVSVADPRNPREIGERWNPPSLYIPRLTYAAPYLYVACSDGGVCIMETLQTGVGESARRPAASRISLAPSLTHGSVRVTVNVTGRALNLEVFDVTGNLIQRRTGSMRGVQTIDLTSAPDGAYLVMVKTEVGVSTTKVVKTRR
jgi:hypothetical protein